MALGVIDCDTGSYIPPLHPKTVRTYHCPDCKSPVVFKHFQFTHSEPTSCPYYSEPTETQRSIDANLRLFRWLQQGVSVATYKSCVATGRGNHAFPSETIELMDSDHIVCRKFSSVIYDSNWVLKYILKTKDITRNKVPHILVFDPIEILEKNYKQIEKDIEQGRSIEIYLCVPNLVGETCKRCMLEHCKLSAWDPLMKTFVSPASLYRYSQMHCPICEKEAMMEKGCFRHKYFGKCSFFEFPTEDDLILDAMHKLYSMLLSKKEICLRVSTNLTGSVDLRVEYNVEDRIRLDYENASVVLENWRVQYWFSFLPGNNMDEFCVDRKDMHDFAKKYNSKYHTRHLPVYLNC